MHIPEQTLELLRTNPGLKALAEAAEGPVYLVGGTVRDLLLGRQVHDYDLVVPSDYESAARKAAAALGARAIPMGRDPLRIFRIHAGLQLDVCPLTGDTLEADLTRRDLTINAMALSLEKSGRVEIIDPTGGMADLDRSRLRFVSEKSITDDPLRLLRLFRFMAQLDFRPGKEDLKLVSKHSGLIRKPSGERIREELIKLLASPNAAAVVQSIKVSGLLFAMFPELVPMDGCIQGGWHHLDVWGHTQLALERLEIHIREPGRVLPNHEDEIRGYLSMANMPALLKLAVIFHDVGKPSTKVAYDGYSRFIGHDKVGVDRFSQIADRIRLSNDEKEIVTLIIRKHLQPFLLMDSHFRGQLTPKGVYRFGRSIGEHLWGLILHSLADSEATQGPDRDENGGFETYYRFLDGLIEELDGQHRKTSVGPPLITGKDLINQFGLTPSPLFREILTAVEEARATGDVKTRDQAIDIVREMLSGDGR